MTLKKFAPKSADVLRQETIKNYGLDAEKQKDLIDKIVADRLKDEELKGSLHNGKTNQIKAKKFYKKNLANAGLDPKTGKPVKKDNPPVKLDDNKDNLVTKDELKAFGHRQKYPNLTDDEYNSINALAKSTGKSFEETLEKNPLAKNYLETTDANERIAGARKEPGNRYKPTKEKTDLEKTEEELDRDLPPGYSKPKSN